MAIDESGLPYVMPTSVPRVTADGRPTTHLINWEESTRNWYFTNAVATDKRITEVKSDTDSAHARITEETNARTTADSALAEQITIVEATVGNVTSNGQIYFSAAVTPAGAIAAYGLYLTAGNTFTGFEALAMSDGTLAIGLTASKFVFTDSGTATEVFTYTGGKFVLTGDVSINGNLLVNGTVVTDKISANAVTNFGWDETTNDTTTATAYVSCRSGDRLVAWVQLFPTVGDVNPSEIDANFTVSASGMGSETNTIPKAVSNVANEGSIGDPIWVNKYTAVATVFMFTWPVPSTGTKSITVAPRDGVRYRVIAQSFSK
jgi:hypothetical protein